MFAQRISEIIQDSIAVKKSIDPTVIAQAAELMIAAYRNGKKLILAGNGGSAADAQHIAGEMVGRFLMHRPALPAIPLNTDTSSLTAIANDYGYEFSFARQLEAHAQPGDVFLAISTSGNSPNLLRAVESARNKQLIVIGLTGRDGGSLATRVDVHINVPGALTSPRIQESHIMIGHILCELVETALFGSQAI